VTGTEKTDSPAQSARGLAPTSVKVKKAARSPVKATRPEKKIPLDMAEFNE
jgi:hypothetical protein